MRALFFASALALSALSAAPAPVRADCLQEQIKSCNDDFGSASEKLVGVRGWCYMIRISWCSLID